MATVPGVETAGLDRGAPVDVPDERGATALVHAADGNRVDAAALLALHEAIVFGEGGPADQATVAALVAGGVDLDIPDGDGTTALAHAEPRGQREVASILSAAGASR